MAIDFEYYLDVYLDVYLDLEGTGVLKEFLLRWVFCDSLSIMMSHCEIEELIHLTRSPFPRGLNPFNDFEKRLFQRKTYFLLNRFDLTR